MWRKYWDRSGNSLLLPRQRRPWGVKLTTIFNPTFVSDGFRIKWHKTLSEYQLICKSRMVCGFNFEYHIIKKQSAMESTKWDVLSVSVWWSSHKSRLRTGTCEILAMYPQHIVIHEFWSAGGVDGVTKCTVKKSKQSILTRGGGTFNTGWRK